MFACLFRCRKCKHAWEAVYSDVGQQDCQKCHAPVAASAHEPIDAARLREWLGGGDLFPKART